MNNTGQGLWTLEVFISPGTQVLQRMSATMEADPTYDAALLAADRVDFAAINPRDLTLEVPSQSNFDITILILIKTRQLQSATMVPA